jgi:hypothetical protein
MVKRHSGVRRGGLTGYKVYELLTGDIQYPVQGRYEGYGHTRSGGGNDFAENYISDGMRADWEANRDALMAFWRSGKYTKDEALAEFGIHVSMMPWFWVCGSRRTKPWAARQFDKDR